MLCCASILKIVCHASVETASTKKLKTAKLEVNHMEALEGLDTLANLAILGEGESIPASSQATTKHPRHRPGCSCIVCIQPPSGKGPKHKQTCTCNVCLMVKRRFRTLMLRREKKQSEKEAETSRKKPQQQSQLPENEKSQEDDPSHSSNTGNSSPSQKKVGNEGSDEDPNRLKSSSSPFKGQIDLNMQPEKEEELSPGSDSGGMMRLLQDANDKYLRQRIISSDGYRTVEGNNIQLVEDGGEKPNHDVLDSNHQEGDRDNPAALNAPTSASLTK